MDQNTSEAVYSEIFEQSVYTDELPKAPRGLQEQTWKLEQGLYTAGNNHEKYKEQVERFYNHVERLAGKEILIKILTQQGLTPRQATLAIDQKVFEIFANILREEERGVFRTPHMIAVITMKRAYCRYRERQHRVAFKEAIMKLRR